MTWPSRCSGAPYGPTRRTRRANSTDPEGQLDGPGGPTRRTGRLATHVEADLGVDDDLLRGRETLDLELLVERPVALDQRQRDRAQLVVAGRGADETDHLLPRPQVGADRGQPVLGAVEVEQRESARRTTEVVHARDGLLAA